MLKKKSNNPTEKWAGNPNRYFSEEDVKMVKRHMKRRSTLIVLREMQAKTTVRYYLTPERMAIITKLTNKC